MIFGFCGPSYTLPSSAIADEECINRYLETVETPNAETKWAMLDAPGYAIFATLPESPERGSCKINSRTFAIGGSKLCELNSDGTFTVRATIANDGKPVSMVASNIQVLIVSAGSAYCYTLADDSILDVTTQLAGVPVQAVFDDDYFVVSFQDSNKFQISAPLDGSSWPGLQVNAVSVFPENIVSIIADHRELWVFGSQHCQPYQDTGSDEVFDVISGGLIEMGSAARFGVQRADNTLLWVHEDERGGRMVYRASGYTPQRISNHAMEADLASYADLGDLVSYVYQQDGHTFYVLYIPGASWTWVYDLSTGFWQKLAEWDTTNAVWGAHRSWNHVYAFGKHLIGDWNSANLYDLSRNYIDNNGSVLRRLRRSPTVMNEMQWISFSCLIIDYRTGVGPQPPLLDGDGNPREPESMLRWSDDRGLTWSNEHRCGLGFAGEDLIRAIWWRLGRSRYRVWEEAFTDPVRSDIVNAYLNPQ